MQYILNALQPCKQACQLIQAVHFHDYINQHGLAVAARIRTHGGHVDPGIGDEGGDVADQTRAVTGAKDKRGHVARLTHADPVDIDEAFALTLLVALDVLTVGTMDNDSLASANKAENLITWQGAAAVGEFGQ